MLPVSAGDATLIVWKDGPLRHAILIDSGLRRDEVASYLQAKGISHLDLIVLSHPDMDHLGGLLAILNSPTMLVERIWCFDLGFLREFVLTGKIPRPQPGTREVLYDFALRSTLDQFSDILMSANGRGIQVLQVAEGHRLSLGGMLLEVLYPPQSFYDQLSSPVAIRHLLVNRHWPRAWASGDTDGERNARRLSRKERGERLTEMFERAMEEEGVRLTDLDPGGDAERLNPDLDRDEGDDAPLKWRTVGTLYNNLSIVVKATFLRGIEPPSILLPGDLSDWTLLTLRQWWNLRADLLKMPHHGSRRIGLDLAVIREAFIDWPYAFRAWPWRRLGHRFWRRVRGGITTGDPSEVLQALVSPSHVLVFPDPSHKLPSATFAGFRSKIVANREHGDLLALNAEGNSPRVARLAMGEERGDVHQLS